MDNAPLATTAVASSDNDTVFSQEPLKTVEASVPFQYTIHYSLPPFFTLQPNLATRAAQLNEWTTLIISYCAFHRIFRLTPSHTLFYNATINRRLQLKDAKVALQYAVDQGRAEWIKPLNKKDKEANQEEAWIWWQSPEEWAQCIGDWIQATGQRNTVLTFYELLEGDGTTKETFHGLPVDMAKKAIRVLVKRGKATVFGEGEGLGVKFFF